MFHGQTLIVLELNDPLFLYIFYSSFLFYVFFVFNIFLCSSNLYFRAFMPCNSLDVQLIYKTHVCSLNRNNNTPNEI